MTPGHPQAALVDGQVKHLVIDPELVLHPDAGRLVMSKGAAQRDHEPPRPRDLTGDLLSEKRVPPLAERKQPNRRRP